MEKNLFTFGIEGNDESYRIMDNLRSVFLFKKAVLLVFSAYVSGYGTSLATDNDAKQILNFAKFNGCDALLDRLNRDGSISRRTKFTNIKAYASEDHLDYVRPDEGDPETICIILTFDEAIEEKQ